MDKIRIEIRLDLLDPTDAAIWAVLEPLARNHRIASKVREALAHYLLAAPRAEHEEYVAVPKQPARDGLLDDIMAGLEQWGAQR